MAEPVSPAFVIMKISIMAEVIAGLLPFSDRLDFAIFTNENNSLVIMVGTKIHTVFDDGKVTIVDNSLSPTVDDLGKIAVAVQAILCQKNVPTNERFVIIKGVTALLTVSK